MSWTNEFYIVHKSYMASMRISWVTALGCITRLCHITIRGNLTRDLENQKITAFVNFNLSLKLAWRGPQQALLGAAFVTLQGKDKVTCHFSFSHLHWLVLCTKSTTRTISVETVNHAYSSEFFSYPQLLTNVLPFVSLVWQSKSTWKIFIGLL